MYKGFLCGLAVVVVVDEPVDCRVANTLSIEVEVAFETREVVGDVKESDSALSTTGTVRCHNAASESILLEDKSLGASVLSGSSARTALRACSVVAGGKVAAVVVRFVARVVFGGWRLARNGCTTRGTTKAPREKLKWSA